MEEPSCPVGAPEFVRGSPFQESCERTISLDPGCALPRARRIPKWNSPPSYCSAPWCSGSSRKPPTSTSSRAPSGNAVHVVARLAPDVRFALRLRAQVGRHKWCPVAPGARTSAGLRHAPGGPPSRHQESDQSGEQHRACHDPRDHVPVLRAGTARPAAVADRPGRPRSSHVAERSRQLHLLRVRPQRALAAAQYLSVTSSLEG